MLPQFIKPILEVMVPLPVPLFTTDRPGLKLAVILFTAFMVVVQVGPLVESQPVQEPSAAPASGVAVRMTVVPAKTGALQARPQ